MDGEVLSKEQYGLVLYLEQAYWRTGKLPEYKELALDGVTLSKSVWDSSWKSALFRKALIARGALSENSLPGFEGKVLTEQQMTVANTLLDVLDSRSRIKKLTELGVSTGQYNLWLRDPLYRAYCLERAESLLIENQPVAHISLINRVTQGDLGAVKYFNSMTGRYRERERAQVEVNVSTSNGTDTLIAIVEIIQRHVKDPATLEAIAGDILALNGSRANSGARGYPLSGTSFINGEIGEINELVGVEKLDDRTI